MGAPSGQLGNNQNQNRFKGNVAEEDSDDLAMPSFKGAIEDSVDDGIDDDGEEKKEGEAQPPEASDVDVDEGPSYISRFMNQMNLRANRNDIGKISRGPDR